MISIVAIVGGRLHCPEGWGWGADPGTELGQNFFESQRNRVAAPCVLGCEVNVERCQRCRANSTAMRLRGPVFPRRHSDSITYRSRCPLPCSMRSTIRRLSTSVGRRRTASETRSPAAEHVVRTAWCLGAVTHASARDCVRTEHDREAPRFLSGPRASIVQFGKHNVW